MLEIAIIESIDSEHVYVMAGLPAGLALPSPVHHFPPPSFLESQPPSMGQMMKEKRLLKYNNR